MFTKVSKGFIRIFTFAIPWLVSRGIFLIFLYIFKMIGLFLKGLPVLIKELYKLCVNPFMLKVILGIGPIVTGLFLLGEGYDHYIIPGIFLYAGLYTMGMTKIKEAFYLIVPSLLVSIFIMF